MTIVSSNFSLGSIFLFGRKRPCSLIGVIGLLVIVLVERMGFTPTSIRSNDRCACSLGLPSQKITEAETCSTCEQASQLKSMNAFFNEIIQLCGSSRARTDNLLNANQAPLPIVL